MNQVFLWSWNQCSQGAKALADAMGIRRIRHERSRFRPTEDKIVINWGSSTGVLRFHNINYINNPSRVKEFSNKLESFKLLDGFCRTVPWTVSQSVAQEWNKKSSVVVRNILTGHSGNGILVVPPNGSIPVAPLYTRYIPKDSEFRVHIVNGEIIDVQRKIRDPDREPTDWKIRNHANGFIFIREGFTVPEDVTRQVKTCFTATGLDFGAIDVIWSEKKQEAYIVEANSAPGIQNTTVLKYKEALKKLIELKRSANNVPSE